MAEEKEAHHDHIEERVLEELARAGYTTATLQQAEHSLQVLHEFLQYVGTHQYYGDAVNKQVFLLGLEADYHILTLQELLLKEKDFFDLVQIALVQSKKPDLDEKKIAEFKAQVSALEKLILELNAKSKVMIEKIRLDHELRSFQPER